MELFKDKFSMATRHYKQSRSKKCHEIVKTPPNYIEGWMGRSVFRKIYKYTVCYDGGAFCPALYTTERAITDSPVRVIRVMRQ